MASAQSQYLTPTARGVLKSSNRLSRSMVSGATMRDSESCLQFLVALLWLLYHTVLTLIFQLMAGYEHGILVDVQEDTNEMHGVI